MSVKDLPKVLRPHGLDDVDDDFSMLQGLAKDDLNLFFNFLERHGFSAGDVLLNQGDEDRALFILTVGTLEVRVETGDTWHAVDTMGEGTFFGEQSFADGHPRTATIVAASAGEFFRLGLRAFNRLSREHPGVALAVVNDVAHVLSLRCRMLQGIRSRLLAEQGQ